MNSTILKSDTLEQAFEKVKLAFDEDRITGEEFIQCYQLHKRTIELTNNVMKQEIRKSDSLEKLDQIKNNMRKAFDSVQGSLSKANNDYRRNISNIIQKSNVPKSSAPSLPVLLHHAMSASERDLRKDLMEIEQKQSQSTL